MAATERLDRYLRGEEVEPFVHLVLWTRAVELDEILGLGSQHDPRDAYTARERTWSTPSGTGTAGHRRSDRVLPATFCRELLNRERVSGVSYAESSIDCRRNAALKTDV